LIDADPRRQWPGQRRDLLSHLGNLLGVLDVPREEDDASKRELLRKRAQLDRQLKSGKAGHQELSDLVTEGTRRHGRTVGTAEPIIIGRVSGKRRARPPVVRDR
jgi:hypothetical protein